MATEVKAAPYEILLRFNCEVGENFGELRGCSRTMGTYLVEGGKIVGRVDAGAASMPADFPIEELQTYLGESFVALNAQLERITGELAAARAELEAIERAKNAS